MTQNASDHRYFNAIDAAVLRMDQVVPQIHADTCMIDRLLFLLFLGVLGCLNVLISLCIRGRPPTLSEQFHQINRNRLETFPPSIRKCKQLQVLRADKNKFSILPQPLSLCQTLVEMSFSDNRIETVPQLFNKMKGLRKLFLERNKFETIPQVRNMHAMMTYLSIFT